MSKQCFDAMIPWNGANVNIKKALIYHIQKVRAKIVQNQTPKGATLCKCGAKNRQKPQRDPGKIVMFDDFHKMRVCICKIILTTIW